MTDPRVTRLMTDEPEDLRPIARLLANRLQRIAVEISCMPLEQRHEAFAEAERWLRETANRWNPCDERIEDDFVNNAMNLLRQFVTDQTR
jgi:hypothetical protein